jgi:hypothetical protein
VTLTPNGLDGRNRAIACELADVELATTIFDGGPWLFSLSRNKHRRHMTICGPASSCRAAPPARWLLTVANLVGGLPERRLAGFNGLDFFGHPFLQDDPGGLDGGLRDASRGGGLGRFQNII